MTNPRPRSKSLALALALALGVSLAVAACVDDGTGPDDVADTADTADTAEASTEQAIGMEPSCPVGDSVIHWYENPGNCGTCTLQGQPARRATEYAACSSNLSGTKKLIRVNACIQACGLE